MAALGLLVLSHGVNASLAPSCAAGQGAAAPGDTVLPDTNFRCIIFLVNTTMKFIISMQILSLYLNPLG